MSRTAWVLGIAAAAVAVLVAVVMAGRGGGGGGADNRDVAASGSFVGGELHSLVGDPTRPERLFVGGHEAAAVSVDSGRTWAQISSLRNADAMGWAVLGDAVWMGGHPGLRRSVDGGRTFASPGTELDETDVHALGGGGGVLYAASPARGLLASADEGRSWEVRSAQSGRAFMGGILVDPGDAAHLVAPDMQSGVMESTDGGRTWRPLASPGIGMTMSVAAVGGDLARLVVAGGGQAARSDDGGRTWTPLDAPEGTMVIAASTAETLYAASLDGDVAKVASSTDGGATWRPLN